MPETIKSLKKENDGLKQQLEELRKEFKHFQQSTITKISENGGHSASSPDPEMVKSLEFFSDRYDDLHGFRELAIKQIQHLTKRLDTIENQVDRISTAIDEVQQYNYQYNVKIIGVPELSANETARVTTKLCLDLFNKMGVSTSEYDVDIAHRVPRRNSSTGPKAIVCKFVRRAVKEEIMRVRREVSKVDPTSIGLADGVSLSNAVIFEHLHPKAQYLLSQAKKVQSQRDYRFCWAKNQKVYLKKTEDSRRLLISSLQDLENLS